MAVSDEDLIQCLVNNFGNKTKTAKELKVDLRSVQRRIHRLIACGKLNRDEYIPGNSPGAGREITSVKTHLDDEGNPKSYFVTEQVSKSEEHEPIIDAPIVRQSVYTGRTGEVVGQWDIRVPRKTQEAEAALVQAIKEEIIPVPPRAQQDFYKNPELLNEVVFSDAHLGSLFAVDSEITLSEQSDIIFKCFEHMISTSPNAEKVAVVILGDWYHFDSILPVTSRSNHVLFTNGDYSRIVKIGIKLMRKIIDWCLIKYKEVEVVICEGNHDDVSAFWLLQLLKTLYQEEERIKFADSDTPFYAISHGGCFLGYHHGHIKGLKDPRDLSLYFASEYRELWGDTKFTYLKTGHLHHISEKDEHGVIIQQQPTLFQKDTYSRQHGYRSVEAAVCTTYSKEYGEVNQNRVTKEMFM